MTVDHRNGHLENVRSVLTTVVYPLQYVVNLPVQAGRWMSEAFTTRRLLLEENRQLREEHFLLKSKLQRFSVLQEENRRLHELLDSSIRIGERVLVAELIAVELEPFRRKIVINKGQRDGVFDGQPVVDSGGVMGQVIHVRNSSRW